MGIVNPSQSTAGQEINASDINDPVNQLANVINGNIDQNNIAASGVGTTQIADGAVTAVKMVARPSEYLADFIYSGGVVAQSAGLVGTFSNIVYYISGVRYTATSVPNKTYTASKDTYVDINAAGTITYTEVANNAASPALTASNIRVAIVITNGSAITSVNQGAVSATAPVVSSLALTVCDSLGNLIYPRRNQTLLGLRRYTSNVTTTSASPAAFSTNVTVPVIVQSTSTNIAVAIEASTVYTTTGSNTVYRSLWRGSVGSGTMIQEGSVYCSAGSQRFPAGLTATDAPGAGSFNYSFGASVTGGTATVEGSSTSPITISVRMV